MSLRWPFFTLLGYGILFSPWVMTKLYSEHTWWPLFYSPQLYFILATWLIWRFTPSMRLSSIGIQWPNRRWLLWPMATFVLLTATLWGLHILLSNTPPAQKLLPYPLPALSILMLFIMAPLAEELFFRGIVFHTLRKFYTLPVAIGASSLLFMATHTQLWLGTLVMGMITAWWTHKSRSIVPGMLFHMLCNALPWLIHQYLGNLSGIAAFLFF